MTNRARWFWTAFLFAHSAALVFLFPDSYQQDGGVHFLAARFAYRHPECLIGVWTRPLFTFLYSLPAQFGYPAAKLFTAAVIAATGHITALLAGAMGFRRAWLAYPLLLVQPVVVLLSFDTMTETLFALFLVAALYSHRIGRPWIAALLISFLPTIRAEGFFVAVFWGFVMLADPRLGSPWVRIPKTLVLALGAAVWWIAAWAVSGDFLYIVHQWAYRGGHEYGYPTLAWYRDIGFEYAGPLVFVLAAIGIVREWAHGRRLPFLLWIFFFCLQAATWELGISAGYARHFACVAPIIALLAVSAIEATGRPAWPRVWAAALLLGLGWSWFLAVRYVDGQPWLRDAFAVREAHAWYRGSGRGAPRKLVWSQAYMAILFDLDLENGLAAFRSREYGLEMLRGFPAGTLIFWDGETGPSWYKIDAPDFEAAGFRRIYGMKHRLAGYGERWGFGRGWVREQEIKLYVKE
ncbi:MAG: hypothetical protein HYY17_15440 [Planctomycetes bacterium]|nr:hypothetical protein [Planctomycetota bacterium]